MITPPKMHSWELNGPIDVYHEEYDSLSEKEKQAERLATLDDLAAVRRANRLGIELNYRAALQIRDNRRIQEAAAHKAAAQYITLQNPETFAGRVRILHGIGSSIHVYDPRRNVWLPPNSDAERVLREAKLNKLDDFRADFNLATVGIFGKPEKIEAIRKLHSLPETLTIEFDDGQTCLIFSHEGGRPSTRFENAADDYRFVWSVRMNSGARITKVVANESTGRIPELPGYFAGWFDDLFKRPAYINDLVEQGPPQ